MPETKLSPKETISVSELADKHLLREVNSEIDHVQLFLEFRMRDDRVEFAVGVAATAIIALLSTIGALASVAWFLFDVL